MATTTLKCIILDVNTNNPIEKNIKIGKDIFKSNVDKGVVIEKNIEKCLLEHGKFKYIGFYNANKSNYHLLKVKSTIRKKNRNTLPILELHNSSDINKSYITDDIWIVKFDSKNSSFKNIKLEEWNNLANLKDEEKTISKPKPKSKLLDKNSEKVSSNKNVKETNEIGSVVSLEINGSNVNEKLVSKVNSSNIKPNDTSCLYNYENKIDEDEDDLNGMDVNMNDCDNSDDEENDEDDEDIDDIPDDDVESIINSDSENDLSDLEDDDDAEDGYDEDEDDEYADNNYLLDNDVSNTPLPRRRIRRPVVNNLEDDDENDILSEQNNEDNEEGAYFLNNVLKEETEIAPIEELFITRQKVIEIFSKIIADINIVRYIEMGIYNYTIDRCTKKDIFPIWENPELNYIYIGKSKSLFTNLDSTSYVKNIALVNRIFNGEIEPEKLAFMTPIELYPEIWNYIIEENEKRNKIIDESIKGSATDKFKCPNRQCRARKAIYTEVQTRSADEPMTIFITCLECGKRWRN